MAIRSALLVLVLAGSVAVVADAPAEAATPPTGFSDTAIATFEGITAVEFMPGDRIVVLEKAGRVRVGQPGSASFPTALTLNVCTNSERGLLGFTHDPGFSGNRFVYLYYTRPANGTCVNRVSRFTMGIDSRIDPASELVLLDNISSRGGNHNGGDLDIGSDGFLYVAVGDAGTDPRGDSGSAGANDAAQDLSLLNGKILRITRDGRPAPGNPLTGPGTARCATRGNTAATPTTRCQELFAWGLRNPYRIAFDRNDGTDRFFIDDVGQRTLEEVDLGAAGANYGWPMREGPCPQGQTPPCAGPPAGLTDPIASYGRDRGASITGGAFVPNGMWPGYDDRYLFGDFVSGNIWMRRADGATDDGTLFASGADGLTDMAFGFDQQGRSVLYYGTYSELRVITPGATTPRLDFADLAVTPIDPVRGYDTQDDTGGPPGDVFAGTTRRVDLDVATSGAASDHDAALVNITLDQTAGPGYVRAWDIAGRRPRIASVNADRAGATVANAAIVPLVDGAFMLEATTSTRVVVDVMGWLDVRAAGSDDGRFVALDPLRLADTRRPAGTPLQGGSSNDWTATARGWTVGTVGEVGIPDDGTAGAVVLSVTAISDGNGGYGAVHPGGGTWPGTSNVNVLPGDVRNNLVVVPLDGTGRVAVEANHLSDVILDVVGYLTSGAAPNSTSGLYQPVSPYRAVDTRDDTGFGRLRGGSTATTDLRGAAVVQNIAVTATSAAGHLATHPDPDVVPKVSNLNYRAPGETRSVLAWSRVAPDGSISYTSLVDTDLVVDVLGYFSG